MEDVWELLKVFGAKAEALANVFKRLEFESTELVDEDAFCTVWWSLWLPVAVDRDEEFLDATCWLRCPHCQRRFQRFAFFLSGGTDISSWCHVCRKKEPFLEPQLVLTRHLVKYSQAREDGRYMAWVRRWHTTSVEAAAHSRTGFCCRYSVQPAKNSTTEGMREV